MENRHYTPKIEELHMGFEFEEEFKNPNYRKLMKPLIDTYGWVKLKLDTSHSLSRITSKIKENRVRVKHLDESDLIKLGWSKIDQMSPYTSYQTNGENILKLRYFNEDRGWLLRYEESNSQFLFSGWVKNKSEMKKLMKMFNIKNK